MHSYFPVLIGSKQSFEYSQHEPDSSYDTILRVLQIDHPLVLRQLIIGQTIEQTVLVKDISRGRELMGEKMPNIKAVISQQPSKMGAGVRFSPGQEGINSNFIEPFTGPPRMKSDTQEAIKFATRPTP